MNYRNEVMLAGRIVENFKFHHNVGVRVFQGKIEVERLSGIKDIVILQITEKKLRLTERLQEDDYVFVCGEIRTYKYVGYDKKVHNKNYVYVQNLYITTDIWDMNNEVRISGVITKKGTMRYTRNGKKVIEVIVATKSNDGHQQAFVPVIFWGTVAEKVQYDCEVKDEVEIKGRFQSRDYIKKWENEIELRTTFEVSAQQLNL